MMVVGHSSGFRVTYLADLGIVQLLHLIAESSQRVAIFKCQPSQACQRRQHGKTLNSWCCEAHHILAPPPHWNG